MIKVCAVAGLVTRALAGLLTEPLASTRALGDLLTEPLARLGDLQSRVRRGRRPAPSAPPTPSACGPLLTTFVCLLVLEGAVRAQAKGYGIDAMQFGFGADFRSAENRIQTAATLASAIEAYSRRYLASKP